MKNYKFTKITLIILLCICIFSGKQLTAEAAQKSLTLSPITFDAEYYYATNTDLQVAFGYDYDALYNHYLTYGIKEGRWGSAEFNCKAYISNYADLRMAFGSDYLSYCQHYEQFGKAENRNAVDQLGTGFEFPSTTTSVQSATVLGSYSTDYNDAIQRATNVELAASRINGVVVQPGASFSFSSTILPRTAANGYVEATVISGGEFTNGMGGGVCQVSSTLYAAMLNANIPATERHPHSLPVSYMPEGMDATISGTAKDLKFKNIFNYPIGISATTADGTLTVSIVAY